MLFEDLIDLETSNKQTHFFGSIVVKPGNYAQDIIVIDGQQRLTTLSLLMLAIKNWLDKNEEEAKKVRLTPEYVLNTFLQDQYLNTTDKLILQPNPRDYKSYKLLFGNEKFYD
ncbi:GmrSD restriction endonuclease domain-containing protein, partial [Staphylococcus arlettae]